MRQPEHEGGNVGDLHHWSPIEHGTASGVHAPDGALRLKHVEAKRRPDDVPGRERQQRPAPPVDIGEPRRGPGGAGLDADQVGPAMPGRLGVAGELEPEPGVWKVGGIPRERRADHAVEPAQRDPGWVEVAQVSDGRGRRPGPAQVIGSRLAGHDGPRPRGARSQRIGRRIVGIVDRDGAGRRLDREVVCQKIRPEGGVVIPQHPCWPGALHADGLVDDEHVVLDCNRAFHRHRHGEEAADKAESAVARLGPPGSERRLAMEAVLHALEGAAGAAVGKEERPAAAIVGEPAELIRRRCRDVGHAQCVPGRAAQNRCAQAVVGD